MCAVAPPPVVVLDDAHRVRNSRATDVIVAFVKGLPTGCHVVIGSRSRPDSRLANMHGRGRWVEFGPAELRLTAAEAEYVLAGFGIDFSGDTIPMLLKRTQGWPAAIHLMALTLQSTSDAVAAIEAIATNPRLLDFLRDEILADEAPETVRFLLRTAALEQMSAPLCDAVLKKTGSAAWLEKIASRNVFIVAERHRRGWYRYHPLFAEMLLFELRRREPDEDRGIRQRAAAWYADHNMPEQAVAHAFASNDASLVAHLVARYAEPTGDRCKIAMIRRWLETCDEELFHEHASLAVTAAWIWALSGQAARAQKCLVTAEASTTDSMLPGGAASLASATAMVRAALAPFGVERMLNDAQTAFNLEPPESAWSTVAALLLGTAQLLNGHGAVASTTLDNAARLGRRNQPAVAAFAIAQQSLLAAGRGDWGTAARFAGESWTVVNAGHLRNAITTLATHLARARVAAHDGDAVTAWREVGAALRLQSRPSPNAFPWFAAQSSVTLGLVFVDLADPAAARRKSQQARRHLNRLLTDGVLRAQHQSLLDALDEKPAQPRGPSTMTLTEAELRVLQLLPTHLSLGEIAAELSVSRNTVKSQVAAIYHKLGSSTRTAAVQRGRDVGLLEV
jgi:LuxR family maltose regulon positive regulatory protein